MNKYHIRFNKSKGQPGRGGKDHAWRVFVNGDEFIFKNVKINVPSQSERSGNEFGDDWNIACEGYMTIDEKTSTATINKVKK